MNYLDLLPHAPPMRLLEEVVEVTPGARARGRRRTAPHDFYFDGHFPGAPVVPAVILIELVAQAGGLAAASGRSDEGPARLRVAAIGAFKFPAAAGANVVLDVEATVAGRMGALYRIEGVVRSGDALVASGSLTLADVGSPRA